MGPEFSHQQLGDVLCSAVPVHWLSVGRAPCEKRIRINIDLGRRASSGSRLLNRILNFSEPSIISRQLVVDLLPAVPILFAKPRDCDMGI